MATSMYRSKVVYGHWIKIGRFYYCSMTGVTSRSVYNISTSLHLSSSKNVSHEKMEHNFKKEIYSLASSKDAGMPRHSLHCYNVGRNDCSNKTMQLKNVQTRNPNAVRVSRWYSDDRGPPKKMMPCLMDFPEIVWPNIIKTLRNWILANLIIRPYFDQEFGLRDFIFGSKQAVQYVSTCLSRGDFAGLNDMVTKEALEEVRKNMSSFTLQQQQELVLSKEDIYFAFPYQIGVMFNDDDKNQQRFVEITMCYHVLQGLKELTEQGMSPPLNMGTLPEYRNKIYICNYRFIREFTKGVEDQWTINVVNHFRPMEYGS